MSKAAYSGGLMALSRVSTRLALIRSTLLLRWPNGSDEVVRVPTGSSLLEGGKTAGTGSLIQGIYLDGP